MYCYYHRQGAAWCPVGRVGTTEGAGVGWRRSATWPLRVYSLRREEHCQGDALYPVGRAGRMAERDGFRWWGGAVWWPVPGEACLTGCGGWHTLNAYGVAWLLTAVICARSDWQGRAGTGVQLGVPDGMS